MLQARSTRGGFTLIELMIVVAIMLALISIVGLVVWTSQQGENVPRGAYQIQGAFVQARNRAAQEKLRNGVRLVPAGNNTSTELVFIHDPGPYAEGVVVAAGQTVTGQYSFAGAVSPGDYIEFNGNGQVYLIAGLAPGDPKTLLLQTPLPQDMVIGSLDMLAARGMLPNYRIHRQPRPVAGMEPIQLPDGAVIMAGGFDDRGQLLGSAWDNTPLNLNAPVDIVFSEKGHVVGPAAAANVIYIWVGDAETERTENNYLVVIYTRTGYVAAYPVNGNPQLGDRYANARLGRAAGGL